MRRQFETKILVRTAAASVVAQVPSDIHPSQE
jgi:hypothetical protein